MSTAVASVDAAPEVRGEKPTGRRRLLAVAVLMLLVAGAAGFLLLRGDAGEVSEPEPPAEGMVVEVAHMTANLAGSGLHYVRFGFAAVLAENVQQGEVEGRFPLLQDAALSEVQAFTADQLRSADGTDELRRRLSARARDLYPDGEVLRVVLVELIVQ